MNIANKLKEAFVKENPVRSLELSEEEKRIVKQWNLLTIKPILYIGNVSESNASNIEQSKHFPSMKIEAKKENIKSIGFSIQLEDVDKEMFLKKLGISLIIF